MLTETANAKVAAEVLEAKSRTAEVEVGGVRKECDMPAILIVSRSHCKLPQTDSLPLSFSISSPVSQDLSKLHRSSYPRRAYTH